MLVARCTYGAGPVHLRTILWTFVELQNTKSKIRNLPVPHKFCIFMRAHACCHASRMQTPCHTRYFHEFEVQDTVFMSPYKPIHVPITSLCAQQVVHAFFGFCDIRQFTDLTEVLQVRMRLQIIMPKFIQYVACFATVWFPPGHKSSEQYLPRSKPRYLPRSAFLILVSSCAGDVSVMSRWCLDLWNGLWFW